MIDFMPMILFSQLVLCFMLGIISLSCFSMLRKYKRNIYMQVYTILVFILSVLWGGMINHARTTDWYPPPDKWFDIAITLIHISTLSTLLYSNVIIFCYLIKKGLFK